MENKTLKRSWLAKKRKILMPYRFQVYASATFPLMIKEKLCDSPHETHGSPVSFS
jgi:hypothetical protein